MRNTVKRALAVLLSFTMVFSVMTFSPVSTVKTYADSLVTEFDYSFAYSTPGYADGTISLKASEDGVYKVFWGDADGEKLTKNGCEYSYLARVVVKDGQGSYNLENDYIAIPEGAATVLVYRKDSKEYTYNIPEDKQFVASKNSYTFGSISDPHYGRYNSGVSEENDDAIPAMKKAMNFLDDAGIEFVAMAGDLTAGGEQTSLDKFNAELANHPNMTVVTAIGNHDSRTTLSTSNKTILDTSISRWYNSITSSYFTVDEDGTINSNLGEEYPILASDALTNPIATQYRPEADADGVDTTVPGLDFVVEAGGNIFIIFNDIATTGETADTTKLVTTGQMDWLEEQLNKYKDRNVFVYQHYYLAVNTLDNDSVDKNNCTGDLKNSGGYSYDLDFDDVNTTTSGKNLQALLTENKNATLVSGHSHWQYSMQGINNNINFGRLDGGNGATLIHLSSVTEPRYIADEDESRTSLNGYASEGATVTTYDDCTVYNNIDFQNEQYEAYATYIVPTGEDSMYEPVKNAGYKESTSAITGDEYLEADDMTVLQMLKSDYNLTLGAGYVYSSKGGENTDGALTDGKSTGSYYNSKSGAKDDQYVKITLDGEQDVSNINYLMIYFVNGLTDSSTFDVQISYDGETYETIGDYKNTSYKTTKYDVDTSNLTIDKFKYIKINFTAGAKDYGYQVKEFALIGYEKNQTPNTANSESHIDGEAPVDYSSFLNTDYNLIYTSEYTQSSTGGENKNGALTDGSLSGFMNTERSSSAKDQTIIIDLGKGNTQSVSNIDYFLLYSQNTMTNVTAFEVSVSEDGDAYEEVGAYTGVDIDTERFDPDMSKVTIEKFRYVKLHLTNGNTNYGYQVKEFAVIGKEPIQFDTVEDQSIILTDDTKNIAYKKDVYVSSTCATEGKDPTVLTDGKKDKYWSSAWDNTLTSDYIVVDLGTEYSSTDIAYTLINYKEFATACEDLRIEFSSTFDEENPTDGFVEVAKTKGGSWEALLRYADPNNYIKTSIIEPENIPVRYVKFQMNGHKGWGFQVYEVAVVLKSKSISDATATWVDGEEYEYTGSAIKPEIVLTENGNTLVEGKQYSIKYSNNVEAGTATATITGQAEYSGTMTKTFKIVPKNLSGLTAKASIDDEGKLVAELGHGDKVLSKGTDYTVSSSVNEDGNLEVVFEAMGTNYTGTTTVTVLADTFPVLEPVVSSVKVSDTDANAVIVTFEDPNSPVAECQTYDIVIDGKAVKSGVRPGTYTITDVNAGACNVSIVARMGEKSLETPGKEITVDGKKFDESSVEISLDESEFDYTGDEIEPDATVALKDSDDELEEDVDYTISYESNINAGTGYVVVKGAGLYTSTEIKVPFTINQIDISNNKVEKDDTEFRTECDYTGSKITQNIVLTYNDVDLEASVDYDVYYDNNVHSGEATVTYEGKGNFKGTFSRTFTIRKIDISTSKVTVDASSFALSCEFNAKDRVQNIKLLYNGNQLNSIVDYEVSYKNNFYPGTATVVFTGVGDFEGTITKTFTITKAKMTSATVKASFNSAKQLVVAANLGSYTMVNGADYTFTSATDIDGNVVVTVKGAGNFEGTVTVKIPASQNPNPAVSKLLKKVSIKKIKNLKSKKAKITWKKVSGITGYEIKYSTKKSFKKKYTKTKKITKNVSGATLKKLKKKKYYVKVRCYVVYNGQVRYGTWSKTKKVTIKK